MLSYKKLTILFLAIGILLSIITFLRDILIPFFLAISIAYLFHPVVCYFEKKNFNRAVAIIVVYVTLLVVVTLFVFGIVPTLYRQVNNLVVEIPVIFADFQYKIDGFHSFFYKHDGLPAGFKKVLIETITKIETKILNELKGLISVAITSMAYLPLLLLTPFLAFYFLNDSRNFALGFIRLFPEKLHNNITSFIYDLNGTLMHYIRGQITVGALVGALTTLGLLLIKMPMAIFLGVLAGVAELIPFFGAFISGSLILFMALTISSKKVALAFAILVVIQQLEANVITPKILGESVGTHPLSIIFLILLGGKFFGIAGMLFIVPIYAVLKILIIHAIPFLESLESN